MVAVDEQPDRVAEVRRRIGSHRPAGRQLRDAENGVDQRKGADEEQQLAALGAVQAKAGGEQDAGGDQVEHRPDRSLDIQRQRPPDSEAEACIDLGRKLTSGQRLPSARRQWDQLQQRQEHDGRHQGQGTARKGRQPLRAALPDQQAANAKRGEVQHHLEEREIFPCSADGERQRQQTCRRHEIDVPLHASPIRRRLQRNGRRTALTIGDQGVRLTH